MSGGFLHELRRRNVIRMAGLYLVGAWLLVQVASTLFPAFGVPDWAIRALVIVLALGFVPALVFSWVFELTPDGLKRDAEVPLEHSIAPQTAQRMDRIIIAVLALALVYFAFDKFVLAPKRAHLPVAAATATAAAPAPASTVADNSIAVLPFVDMSQAKDQEYFSDGLSEELLNQLAQIPQLRVIARTSSFSFKGKEVGIAEIARILKVAHVLEGSVRKSGNTLRITAQLIRASDSSHLWSQTYDRQLTDVFKVQDEIAAAVVDALKVQLLPTQSLATRPHSANPDAYDQFLIGRQFNTRGTEPDWHRAIAAFGKAITLDPGYAPAYAELASAQGVLADAKGDTAGMQASLRSADIAIRLAPALPDGYVARAIDRMTFNHDWRGAEADIDKALALDAGDATVQFAQARLMVSLGRLPEAIAAARKSTQLDPLSPRAWADLGRYLNADHQLQAGREAIQRALEISPESKYASFHLGETALLEDKPQDALRAFAGSIDSGYGLAGIAMARHSLGQDKESLEAMRQQIARFAQSGAYQIAEAYAWRGEKDEAFHWLDRAYTQRDGGLAFIKCDPLMANLQGDPRYGALLKKLGLPT